jgi:hypothetical protein
MCIPNLKIIRSSDKLAYPSPTHNLTEKPYLAITGSSSWGMPKTIDANPQLTPSHALPQA